MCGAHRDAPPPLLQMLAASLSPFEFHLLSVPQLHACRAHISCAGQGFPTLHHAALSLGSAGLDAILQ